MPRWFRRSTEWYPPPTGAVTTVPVQGFAAGGEVPEVPTHITAAPAGVRVYETSADYIAENPARRGSRSGVEHDPDGWDVQYRFGLTEPRIGPVAPGSHWRISVNPGEIYAVRVSRSADDRYCERNGPVWLIAELPEAATVLRDFSGQTPIRALLWEVEQQMRRPDSLLTAVAMIRGGVAALSAVPRPRAEPMNRAAIAPRPAHAVR